MLGLYLHIPYCEGKCLYCDFYAQGGSHTVPDAYLDALLRELFRFSPCAPLRPDTLYFGGGTPSLLTPAQAARLIDAADPLPGAEITLEANPGTVTQQTLEAFHSAGVNRLSLGVQTARDESLARLGRRHTALQSKQALAMARAAGFTNISGDAMLALPHYTMDELRETVDLLAEGGCTHVSTYLLKIEENTVFARRPPDGLPSEDAAAEFYLAAVDLLAQYGYAQYEISNFAHPGRESRHNLIYWHCEDYLGLGPAAHSCMAGKRFSTKGGTRAFLAGENTQAFGTADTAQKSAAVPAALYEPQGTVTREDYCMLALRLCEGLSLQTLETRWGGAFSAAQAAFLNTLCQNGMARLDGDRLMLTPRGMLVQNSILARLL